MTSTHAHAKTTVRLLAQVRQRMVLAAAFKAIGSGVLAAGLLAACTVALLALRGATLPLAWLAWGSIGMVLLFTAVSLWRMPFSSLDVAKAIESREPGIAERFSTALEVERGGPSILREALLHDSDQVAGAFRPAVAVPMGLGRRRGLLAVAGLVLLLLAGGWAQRMAGGIAGLPATPPAALGQSEAAAAAEQLQALADDLLAQATRQADPYLEAVARELQSLAPQVERGEIQRGELVDQLRRLYEHAQVATMAPPAGPQPRSGATPSETLSETLAGMIEAIEQGSMQVAQQQAEEPTAQQALQQPSSNMIPELGEDGVLGEDRPTASEYRSVGEQGGPGTPLAYTDLDPAMLAEVEREREMRAAMLQAGGEIIGAAAEAGAGGSVLAGDGSQDLFGMAELGDVSGRPSEAVWLPERADQEGQTIRVEVIPDSVPTAVRDTPLGTVTWIAADESLVARAWYHAEDRIAVAAYRTPSRFQQEASAP